jgi:hypothetical protein
VHGKKYEMVKPNFFIVGALKSGTTALYNYLKQHPQVYLPKKEIYYFCHDLTFRTPPISESIYLGYYADVITQKAIGDASVHYLQSTEAAQKIKSFNPQARIIIMLRNPVEMVYSLHNHLVFNGDEPIEDFEKAIDAEKDRKAGRLIPPYYKCPLEAMFYSEVADYYEQVLCYTSVFDKEHIHIIFFEDFKANTEAEYKKVLNFLELEEIIPPAFDIVNPSKGRRSKVFLNFLINPPGFIKSTGRFLFPHHSKRREWIIDRLWNLNTKYRPLPPLPDKLKLRLLDIYKDNIVKLGNLLNRDMNEWLKM